MGIAVPWPTVDKSPENLELAREMGFHVEQRGRKGPAVYFLDTGGFRGAQILELAMWKKLLAIKKEISAVKRELEAQDHVCVTEERKRITTLIQRASREMSLHQATLAVMLEIVNNPNAESELFGGIVA